LALCKARSLIANATIEGREVRQRLKKIAYFSADPDVDPLDDKAFVKLLDVVQQLFSATQADWTAADKAMKETYTHRYLMLSYVGRFVKYNIFLQVIIFVGFYFGIASRLIHLIHEVFHRDSETEAFTQYILRIVRYVFNDPGNLLRRVYHRLRQDVRGL